MKRPVLIMLFLFILVSVEAQTSKKNYTGYWSSNSSWIGGDTAPGGLYGNTYGGTLVANVFGHIIRLGDLSVNNAIINVKDTLVVSGDFSQTFDAKLHVDSDGLLIVFGDFGALLFNKGVNNGTIIVMGTLNFPSSNGANSFNNNGNFYVQNVTNSSGISGDTLKPIPSMPTPLSNFVNSPAVLPILIKDFVAQKVGQGIALNWSTLTEKNFSHFEVERKAAGDTNFERITSVKGVGESTELQEYQYTDVDAPYGSVYYRLKQVDNDGTFEYSPIVAVTRQAEGPWSAYPNPVNYSGKFQIRSPRGSEILQVALISPKGNVLWQKQGVENQQVFSIPENAKTGLYFVQVYTDQGLQTLKIIKP